MPSYEFNAFINVIADDPVTAAQYINDLPTPNNISISLDDGEPLEDDDDDADDNSRPIISNLIPMTSDLYKRRLVKTIRNSFEHGIYFWSQQVLDIKFSNRQLQIRKIGSAGKPTWYLVPDSDLEKFVDGYGRQLCASRTKTGR